MFMQKFIISLFLFISIASSACGQDVKVTSSFDSTKIFIGDQIKYTVTVDKPNDLRLNFPVFKDTICKNIDIVSGPNIDSVAEQNGRIKIIHKYLITSFDSGRYQVKPVFAEVRSGSGLKRYYSDYSLLEVIRVKIAPPDSTAKIFDIIAPYKARVTLGEILPWLLLLVLVCALVWAVIRYIRSRKKSEGKEEIFIPVEPAHIIAFRELEILKGQDLWQKGEIKKYYTRLTEILRQYLENRFRVYSLELTSAETLDALVRTGFKKNGSYNDLKSVLTGADLVKFAKYNPIASENEAHFQTSWDFIQATMVTDLESEPVEQKLIEKEASV
jgi:thioredoxin-related protein